MGIFKWISKQCPCGGIVEFQTKAVEGYGEIDLDKVPVAAVKDLVGQVTMCRCKKVYMAVILPEESFPMDILET